MIIIDEVESPGFNGHSQELNRLFVLQGLDEQVAEAECRNIASAAGDRGNHDESERLTEGSQTCPRRTRTETIDIV